MQPTRSNKPRWFRMFVLTGRFACAAVVIWGAVVALQAISQLRNPSQSPASVGSQSAADDSVTGIDSLFGHWQLTGLAWKSGLSQVPEGEVERRLFDTKSLNGDVRQFSTAHRFTRQLWTLLRKLGAERTTKDGLDCYSLAKPAVRVAAFGLTTAGNEARDQRESQNVEFPEMVALRIAWPTESENWNVMEAMPAPSPSTSLEVTSELIPLPVGSEVVATRSTSIDPVFGEVILLSTELAVLMDQLVAGGWTVTRGYVSEDGFTQFYCELRSESRIVWAAPIGDDGTCILLVIRT